MDAGRAAAAAVEVESLARIREQTVALLRIDLDALSAAIGGGAPGGELLVELEVEGAGGPSCVDAGPLTHACESAILNYESPSPAWRPSASRRGEGRGTVTYCATSAECAAAGTDILFVAAASLASTPALRALALHHASYLDLNVSIFSVQNLPELTPEALRDFIEDVYETRSSASFGDGHVGFVVLVGDSYADDNQTVMIPAYDGYGGDEVASDHYYACVSGPDDLEDVMIGRLPVGNLTDLSAVVTKAGNYMPVDSTAPWSTRALLVGGMFYAAKDDYVALFDEYDALVPDDFQVDRLYRHDYETDQDCALDVVDRFNDGYLIVNFAGDGWISTWDRTLSTTHIAGMENSNRLPIVLSMACATGWSDNTTYPDSKGSYDCLAEQFVNAPSRGAIACLAASRASDGGMFRTLTESIYRAVFDEHALFIGEAIAVGKLLHIQDGGEVTYVRHFNLFGDPVLIFAADAAPTAEVDLAVKPYETTWVPELPGVDTVVTATVGVANQSSIPMSDVTVRLTGVGPGGAYQDEVVIPFIAGWASESVLLEVPDRAAGQHTVEIAVDPDRAIVESDETNNSFSRSFYVYRHVPGFPLDLGVDLHTPAVGAVGGVTRAVVLDDDARVRVISSSGTEVWTSAPAVDPLNFDPEITPALADVDGDGENEVVATRRLGLAAFDGDGAELWSLDTKDPVGYPALADVNADGISDIVVATYGFFGETSDIIALRGNGQLLWTRSLASGAKPTASPAVADLNQDGRKDIVYGTNQGRVGALTTTATPPTHMWGPVQVSLESVAALALGDVDADGTLEILAASDNLYCLNAESGGLAWTLAFGADVCCLAVADVDGDGAPEVVAGAENGALSLVKDGAAVWTVTLPGRPTPTPVVADMDGDGVNDILVATEDGALHMLSASGSEAGTVPIPGTPGSPFLCDVDDDDAVEAAVATDDGLLFVLRFDGRLDDPIEWVGPGRSAAHTSAHAQPFSGTIYGTVTLSGDYSVGADLVVCSGATLELAPGTLLTFASNDSPALEIGGSLVAEGTAGNEVALRAGGTRGAWDGIRLLAGSTAALSSCRIEGAAVGIQGTQAALSLHGVTAEGNGLGMALDRCTLNAVGCTFSSSDSLGARLLGGGGTIRGSFFTGNALGGLVCRDGAAHQIIACTASESPVGHGVACYRLANVTIDSCTVALNAGHGVLVKNSSPVLKRSTISDNAQCGMRCMKTAYPSVTACSILRNAVGVYAEPGSNPNLGDEMHPQIGYNWIEMNEIAAVANYNSISTPIQARRNWWGSAPPDPGMFIGRVVCDPWLVSSPMDMAETGVDDDLPPGFELGQNVPNPFNPVTTIAYAVPAPGADVAIAVYDVSGKLVRTLLAGFREAGAHEVVWDGRDARGEAVAAGVYFARMDAPGSSSTRKLILLK